MSERNKGFHSSFKNGSGNETYLGFEVSVSNKRKGTKFKAKGVYHQRGNPNPSMAGRILADRLNKACLALSKRSIL